MGVAAVITITFLVAFTTIYLLMQIVCFIKRRYCEAELLICRIISMFSCESCKESCHDHKKLLARAILFSLIITIVLVVTMYCF